MTGSFQESIHLFLGLAELFFGLVLPLQGFFRLGRMRARDRRQQSSATPVLGLVVTVAICLVGLGMRRLPSFIGIYGVIANALWLWVVTSRGRKA